MKKILVVAVVLILLSGAFLIALYEKEVDNGDGDKGKANLPLTGELITEEYTFSYPTFGECKNYTVVYVNEADFYDIHDGWPVIPVKTETYEFPFGTRIINVSYEYSEPEIIELAEKISVGSCSVKTWEDETVYESDERFPSNFVSYKTGGGLSNDERKTFLTVRINPITYRPLDYEIDYIHQVKVAINYEIPETPPFYENNEFDLLIITVSDFKKPLNKLVTHKEKMGVKTKLVTLNEIQETQGRDTQEKIKYYIKESIENCGIKYVLLVGGIKGQSSNWNIPIRYSHVLLKEGKQESPEPEFISDLYYADIYDSEGNFSSWDTDENDIFAEYEWPNEIDKMDLYPDVYLGRLPCRNKREVRIVVDKIINYEKSKAADSWFKKLICISGDHWPDPDQIAEGILIMERTKEIMSDFKPVELYGLENSVLLIRDITKAINKGAGFAYFCGHGSTTSWGIKYPPDAKEWGPSFTKLRKLPGLYNNFNMNFLINGKKLPITVVGGCLNGKYDISISNSLKNGAKIKNVIKMTECWAWKLTSKKNGGSIATIANTGLGTHAMSDADSNGVNDYLETLDGWMELRFFELYSYEDVDILGNLHSGAMNDYLHTFLNSNDEMDTKMVQQWQLFGDPSLKVGGYQ